MSDTRDTLAEALRAATNKRTTAEKIAAFLHALPTCSIVFERHGAYGQKVLAAVVKDVARKSSE